MAKRALGVIFETFFDGLLEIGDNALHEGPRAISFTRGVKCAKDRLYLVSRHDEPEAPWLSLCLLPKNRRLKTVIRRYILVAATCAAMFLGGATIASAGSTNIQFTDLTITNGAGANVVTTVTLNGVSDPGTFSANAAFASLPGEFKLSSVSQSVDLHFNPQIDVFAKGALYLGEASSWTVSPSLIPAGEVITDVSVSLSSSNFKNGSGVFAGTITIDTSAVPEPSSMIMASTAVIALGVLRVLRARRRGV